MSEIDQLQTAIDALETQRALLGDAVVDAALAPMREKLAALRNAAWGGSTEAELLRSAALEELAEPPAGKTEQRKRVTILFADLVGFTPMAEKTDPEDIQAILKEYFTRWSACIEAGGGSVEKLIGDAILAIFGLPTAHEDDPERAVLAGLAMQRELAVLNAGWEAGYNLRLSMRIGIHTGLIVISRLQSGKSGHYEVLGDAVNLASRLQTASPIDSILISQETYRSVKGAFDLQSLGILQLKGKSEPVSVYKVLAAKQRAFRVDPRGVEGVDTPLVGRNAELERLQNAYLDAQSGAARQVIIAGEAGIGKTRLLSEFHDWLDLRPENIWFFKGRAGESTRSNPYFLLRDLVAYRFAIMENDSQDDVQRKLEDGIAQFIHDEAPMKAHFLGASLGFDLSGSPYLTGVRRDPRQLADRARMYLDEFLTAAAQLSPVVILLEDLHWADDQSLTAIAQTFTRLSAHSPAERMLIVCSTRPALFERRPDWQEAGPGKVIMQLRPLTNGDTRLLAQTILSKIERLPVELIEIVVQRSEGNPFFLEELIKMFIEQGVIKTGGDAWSVNLDRAGQIQVPPSLTEVLQARLDNLPDAGKSALQRAAVVGRIFWEKAVAQLFQTSRLPAALDLLQRREMIFPHDRSSFEGDHEFSFKHALLRDVTYDNILKRDRRVYHALIARWLADTARQNHRQDEFAALIAGHYAAAGLKPEAAGWYQAAAAQAAAQYANREAAHLYGLALELTAQENLTNRIALLFKREAVLLNLADRPAQQADLNAIETLLEEMAKDPTVDPFWIAEQTAVSYNRRANVSLVISDYPAAINWAEKSAEIAHKHNLLGPEAEAHLGLGIAFWRLSDHDQAVNQLEKALRLAHQAGLPAIEASALRHVGIIHDAIGDFPRARQYLEDALDHYKQIGDLSGEARCTSSLGAVFIHMGDFEPALAVLNESLNARHTVGDRYGEGVSLTNIAHVFVALGKLVEARQYYQECLEICREIEDLEGEAAALNGLGTLANSFGQYREAEELFGRALELARRIGDQQGECGTLAAIGLLHLLRGDPSTALEIGRQAIDLARKISARFEEGYALTYLGHVLRRIDRFSEAAQAYQDALAIRRDNPAQMIDDFAGLAEVELAQLNTTRAVAYVDQILSHIEQHGTEGIEDLMQVQWTCYRVLREAGDPRWKTALAGAVEKLNATAEQITDEQTRRSYLENVPANAAVIAAWKQAG